MRAGGEGKKESLALRQLFDRLHHYELTHRAAIHELDSSCDLRKQGVVFSAANVQTRLHSRPTLTHNDRASGDNLPAESFEAQPLRVRVAAIP